MSEQTKLAEWSMNALDFYSGVQIPKLLAVIKLLIEDRDLLLSDLYDGAVPDYEISDRNNELAKILEDQK